MPVAMVPPPRGGLAFEMVVEFGVENTLGKRLLQLVEKPVLASQQASRLRGPSPHPDPQIRVAAFSHHDATAGVPCSIANAACRRRSVRSSQPRPKRANSARLR